MKYLGYVCIILAIAAGYFMWSGLAVLGLALVSTVFHATARQKDVKSTPMKLKPNMILDGAYLFFGQALILFAAYLIGVFAVSPAGDQFLAFFTGQR